MVKPITSKLIEKMFGDADTRKKLLILVEIEQRERFLNREIKLLTEKARIIENEINAKYKLDNPFTAILTKAILQQEEYKHLLEKYGEEYKSKKSDTEVICYICGKSVPVSEARSGLDRRPCHGKCLIKEGI